jgi:hypothetical protein
MPKRGETPPEGTSATGKWVASLLTLMLIVAACAERDRLVFPSGPGLSDSVGPITTIDQPNGADTTVSSGPQFFVNGRTIDPDGVDSVYFFVIGGSDQVPPFRPNPASDTVRFGLQVSTAAHQGDTILVQVRGVDSHGNQGATASRRIFVE